MRATAILGRYRTLPESADTENFGHLSGWVPLGLENASASEADVTSTQNLENY